MMIGTDGDIDITAEAKSNPRAQSCIYPSSQSQGKCAGAKWLEAILKRTRPFGVNSSRLVKNQLRHKLRAAGVSARGNTEGGQPSASPRLGVSS